MPTCIEPKLPPPAKTKAVFALAGSRGTRTSWSAAKSVMAVHQMARAIRRDAVAEPAVGAAEFAFADNLWGNSSSRHTPSRDDACALHSRECLRKRRASIGAMNRPFAHGKRCGRARKHHDR